MGHLVELTKGGADYTFDCTGNVTVMRQALECCHKGWGTSIIIGVAPAGAEIATRPFQLVTGRNWRGSAFGGARGRTDVPRIVDWYMDGRINIDDLITDVIPLEQINEGFHHMHEGKGIRTVVPLLMTGPERTGGHRCFGGDNGFYKHASSEIGGIMTFTVYVPPQARHRKVPALLYLAGLTCNHETFIIKGGAQRLAAEYGLILVAPDTSPRDKRHPGDDEAWDFGIGAGFYVDATQAPWRDGYRMGSYVAQELPALVEAHFPVSAWGVFGHSMGGHGALVTALRNPGRFKSVSAFAPIAAPSSCPWGKKALGHYLGADRENWTEWDATALVKAGRTAPPVLIDQGTADPFLERELRPHLFQEACQEAGQALNLRMQEGYDHSYYLMSTFMEDHIQHHVQTLGA